MHRTRHGGTNWVRFPVGAAGGARQGNELPGGDGMQQGKFKRSLSVADLNLIGLGAIFGSGWLFAASHVASIAGPAGILSWLIGGVACSCSA